MFQLPFETGQQSMWGNLLSMAPKGGTKESKEMDQAFSGLKQIKRMQKCQVSGGYIHCREEVQRSV